MSSISAASVIDIVQYKAQPEEYRLLRQLQTRGVRLTSDNLVAAKGYEGVDPGIIDNILKREANARQPAAAVTDFRVREAKRSEESKVKEATFMAAFDRFIIGQPSAKAALAKIFVAREESARDTTAPFVFGMPGPSGSGKTETFRALAYAFHDDPECFVRIDAQQISAGTITGSDPGLVGGDVENMSPLSDKNVQAATKGKTKPLLILIDELDKLPPDKRDELANALAEFMLTGKFTFKSNGKTVTYEDVIIGVAANFGYNDVGSKTGEDARNHFTDAFRKNMPKHINSRCTEVVAYDFLEHNDVMEICRKLLRTPIEQQLSLARAGDPNRDIAGKDITIQVTDELLDVMAKAGFSRDYGARPVADLLRKLVEPKIKWARESANDDEHWVLDLANVNEDRIRHFHEECQAAIKAGAGTPANYSIETAPVRAWCAKSQPVYFPYQGVFGFDAHDAKDVAGGGGYDPTRAPMPLSSGLLGGLGFALYKSAPDQDTQLRFLRPGKGATAAEAEANDRWEAVEVPKSIRGTILDQRATPLSLYSMLVYTVKPGADGKSVEQETWVLSYRHRQAEWTRAESNPDKPIVGASLVGAKGKALLYGGREQVCVVGRDGEAKWFPAPDKPDESFGEDIERAGYFFNESTMKWHRWENAPQKGRALASALAYDPTGRPLAENASPDANAKFVFFGGEVLERPPGQKWKSVATNEVIVVDPEKETFTTGEPIPKRHATVGAAAFLDQSGKPRLEGGMQYAQNGRIEQVSTAVVRGAKDWKERKMPLVGSFLMCVPRTEDSWVNGPFFDPATGEWEFQILRPDYTK